jgi:beta-lactamase regulating signal transducer with metallopeptidase domain
VNVWISNINLAAAGWFETILRATWQGAIALVLVWMVSRWIAAIPGRYKAWLWRLAFLKLLLALLWVTPVSLAILPARPVAIASPSPALQSLALRAEWAAATAPLPETHALLDWRAWLLVAWIAGVLRGTARIARHWRAARGLRRDSAQVYDSLYQDMLQRLAATFRLRRVPALHHTDSVTSPMLLGLIRPSIVLPSAVLRSFDAPRIEMMLAHELAHVHRRDLWWLWLFTVCEALFFFHPLVWLARREWNLATESACDELALRLTRRAAQEYGSMLVDVVAQINAPRRSASVLALGMFETGNIVKRRLRVMNISQNPITRLAAIILIAVGMLALVPFRLVAGTPDAETLDRLKEENAKLKQQLDATRREIEALRSFEESKKRAEIEKQLQFAEEGLADTEKRYTEAHPDVIAQRRKVEGLRQQAMSARQQDEAKRATEQTRSKVQAQREAIQRLDLVRRQRDELRKRYTDDHPDVIAKQRELERLQQDFENNLHGEGQIGLDLSAPAETRRFAAGVRVERGVQWAVRGQQRELLLEEIKLAERQAESIKNMRDNGKALSADVLNVQRELLDLKLQLAELEGSKAEQRAVLLQQLNVAEGLLKEERKRVQVGILSPGAEIPFEREVLRLKRALAALE